MPLTISAAAVAITAALFPAVADAIEDRPGAIASLELWRLLTGSFAHAGAAHLALNLALFLPLAALRESQVGSARAAMETALLALAVACGIRLVPPDWNSYRGLSGVVYGAIAIAAFETRATGAWTRRLRAIGPTVAVLATIKTALECARGGWLGGAGELGDALGVRYLPGSHLGGIAAGLVIVAVARVGAARVGATRRSEPERSATADARADPFSAAGEAHRQ